MRLLRYNHDYKSKYEDHNIALLIYKYSQGIVVF